MARSRKTLRKHKHPSDHRYDSQLVARFVRALMMDGKKFLATRIFYDAMDEIAKKGSDPMETFTAALNNVRPVLEVQSRRVGGTNYQIPIEVRPARKDVLGMRWLIASARNRKEKSMALCLAKELLDAAQQQGSAVRKKEDIHKMAEANRPFAHLRW